MPKNIFYVSLIFTLMVVVAGCSMKNPMRDVTTKRYIQDKKRVDLDIPEKAGNWQSAPDATATEGRLTRKMYVLEFTKDVEGIDKKIVIEESTFISAPDSLRRPTQRSTGTETERRFNFPDFNDEEYLKDDEVTSGDVTTLVEYTVEKNDTLQKISKKFYDSYSQWPKIYEVNRDVLKNPDSIKPGIVIKIPLE